jgi:MFS family permease
MGVLLAAIDAYVVVAILVPITRDLEIPVNHLERATPIITGYLLGYVAAMPLLAGASDRWGRRGLIEACLLVFAGGSLLTALATSLPVLVAGRVVQGAAGGALLPVTLALVADLWRGGRRTMALGLVGGTQELGSVLGPLYGAALAAAIGWRGLFAVNVPLALLASAAVHLLLPRRSPAAEEGGPKEGSRGMDVPGGLLLALSLGALVLALYNPDPQARAIPAWGPWALGAACASALAFVAWERRAAAPLLDLRGVERLPLWTALAVSLLSGAALMVTLVDVPLEAQTVFGTTSTGGALLLARFLAALPVGAVIGGLAASRVGERVTAVVGSLLAAAGFLLVAGWSVEALGSRHAVGPLSLPRVDADLIVAGLGLGLLVAPVISAALGAVRPAQHGSASAAVVVSRMVGMLAGVAALAAWGLHRFAALTADLLPPIPGVAPNFQGRLAAYERAVAAALHVQYRETFLAAAAICLAGAVASVGLGHRRDHHPATVGSGSPVKMSGRTPSAGSRSGQA